MNVGRFQDECFSEQNCKKTLTFLIRDIQVGRSCTLYENIGIIYFCLSEAAQKDGSC